MDFNYDIAFSRNLGWLTEQEFQKIKHFKIAIAGLGGVGGSHLMALVRMGFSRFIIADFDKFEMQNFNRQYGANMSTLQKNKCEVMKDLALQVNPQAEINILYEGVNDDNLDQFLENVHLYVDGLDLFELNVRQKIFRETYARRIPSVTSAPLGFGASCMIFGVQSVSFDEYFQFKPDQQLTNVLKFVLGLSPSLMQVKYLVDKKYSNLAQGKTSSTPAGCFAASSIVCAEATKILLERGSRKYAPMVLHYDFYLNKMKTNYVFMGMKNPLLKLKLFMLKMMLKKINKNISS